LSSGSLRIEHRKILNRALAKKRVLDHDPWPVTSGMHPESSYHPAKFQLITFGADAADNYRQPEFAGRRKLSGSEAELYRAFRVRL